MTDKEFEELALSKVRPGQFAPVAIHDADNDTLEILISNESYRRHTTDDPYIVVYSGRDSDEITGVLIRQFARFMKGIRPDIHLEVHNGKFKVAYLFKAIREHSKKAKNGNTLAILIKKLEDLANKFDLEASLEGCAASTTG
jgi:hypothetical protein